jgi:cyclohexanecarboxylate-CoA ligase
MVADNVVQTATKPEFSIDARRLALEARARFWPDRTIIDYLDDSLAVRPSANYLTAYLQDQTNPVALDYAGLAKRVTKIAVNLSRLGTRRGDVVSFQIPNWWQFIAVYLACVRIGAVSNPLMPIFRERELDFMVRSSGAKIMIVPRIFRRFDHEQLAARIQRKVSTLDQVIVIDGNGENSFASMLLHDVAQADVLEAVPLQPNDVMKIMYTSGTTGEPKGVMHTSNTLLCSMKSVSDRLGLTENDVIFMPSPFAHSIGFCYGILLSLFLGARLVTMDVWDPQRAADIIERNDVTFMFGATPFVADLTNLPGIDRRDLSKFRIFLTAGAPIPPTLVEKGESVLGASIVPGYGMTELGLVSATIPADVAVGKGTDGIAMPHVEFRIIDDKGRELSRNSAGELQCRGSSLFVGYHKRPDLYDVGHEGWFSTGDIAVMDDNGYIRIVGRSKDIIIRGGENIPVIEVENLIHEMPEINEVAIVGMPDDRLGERSCAFVSLHREENLTLADVTEYLEGRNLARNYLPEKLVIIDSMPKTPAGKLQKFRLREMMAQSARSPG